MTTLVINGKNVTVSDDFLNLSPEEQNATVDEIAQSMGASSPSAMADGMASLSDMSRNPRVVAPQDGPMPPPPAEAASLPGSMPTAPYENSLPATAAQFGVGTQSGIANTLGFPVDALTGAITVSAT